jgi:hypothetical protein
MTNQRNDRRLPLPGQHYTKCLLTCGFGARGEIRTLDLPITRRMLGVGLDGSRRIQKDRLDDQTDDQGASDRKSDGKASNSASGVLGFRREVPSTILMSAMNVVVLPWSGCVQAPLLVHE